MFITLTNIKSGEPVKLGIPIDNRFGNKKAALYEAFYKVTWVNIDSSNNWIHVEDLTTGEYKKVTIGEGYYDFDTLEKELFRPNRVTAKLNKASLIVTLQPYSSITMPRALAEILGFRPPFVRSLIGGYNWEVAFSGGIDPDGNELSHTGEKPINLEINPLLFVHLTQLKTTQNQVVTDASSPSVPSDLLSIILPSTLTPNELQHNAKQKLQFNMLEEGFHETFTITIKDIAQKRVVCDSLHVILKIK